jgi:putative FmdB family regulatory protein
MPTYQYSCSKCGEDLEVYQSFTDAPLKRHKGCGGSLQKVFAPVGIVLKGSGFYKTDSRTGASKSEKTEKPETKVDASSSSDSAAANSSAGGSGAKKDGATNGSGKGSGKKAGKGGKPAKQSA